MRAGFGVSGTLPSPHNPLVDNPYRTLDQSRRRSAWLSIGAGLGLGVLVAVIAALGMEAFFSLRSGGDEQPAQTAEALQLFRLPNGGPHEAYLLPAGPDGQGEERLAGQLFPGEAPTRRLASLLLANVSESEAWDVDLEAEALRCRTSESAPWEPLERLPSGIDDAPGALDPSSRLRLRSLGAGVVRLSLQPRSMKRVLLALPPDRQFSDLSDVQWGALTLRADRLDLEQARDLREDPATAR